MRFRTLAVLSILAFSIPSARRTLRVKYRPVADKLINAALADTEGYERLTYLCHQIGARLSADRIALRAPLSTGRFFK